MMTKRCRVSLTPLERDALVIAANSIIDSRDETKKLLERSDIRKALYRARRKLSDAFIVELGVEMANHGENEPPDNRALWELVRDHQRMHAQVVKELAKAKLVIGALREENAKLHRAFELSEKIIGNE